MKAKAGYVAVALAAIVLSLNSGPAVAAAMDCGGQTKTCLANCAAIRGRPEFPLCVKDCQARQTFCMRTSCWNDGPTRYCGLLRR